MARMSKANSFTIYEDARIPTPDSGYPPSFDDAIEKYGEGGGEVDEVCGGEETDGVVVERDADGGDELDGEGRRQSAITRTSISSLPESTYRAEEKPYAPPVIRPSFMRPESVRRMQMSRSPKNSVLRHTRSRTGTPQSIRSAKARGSPAPRRHASELTQALEDETKFFPLVLLHVTLLPRMLPWTAEAVQELLPQSVLDNLRLLKSKVSETIAARGLLIPHPQAEYELIEERLLEALELKEERITKCGHYRNRDSVDSDLTASGESDSGLGSSVEELDDGELCAVCDRHINGAKSGVGTGKRKWSIKVYAANGLMRAPAWAAAWTEMESVDVEILPWIDEETRKALHARTEEQLEEQRLRDAEIERKVMQSFERQQEPVVQSPPSNQTGLPQPAQSNEKSEKPMVQADLPQVYRPSQIPLSVLLKNYVFLLAQDRRNVAIFFLALVAIWLGMRTTASASDQALVTSAANASLEQPAIAVVPNADGFVSDAAATPMLAMDKQDVPDVAAFDQESALVGQSDDETKSEYEEVPTGSGIQDTVVEALDDAL